jgi:phage tail tape-measure protein
MNIFNSKIVLATILAVGSVTLAGCETTSGGNNTLTKGAIGAGAGAILGSIIGNNAGDGDAQSGALIGAVIGAVIGGAGGAYAGCRQDGGCGAQPKPRRVDGYQQQPQPPVTQSNVNRRQYYDQNTGRYYYYDPATRQEYYENGERKAR